LFFYVSIFELIPRKRCSSGVIFINNLTGQLSQVITELAYVVKKTRIWRRLACEGEDKVNEQKALSCDLQNNSCDEKA